MLPPFIIEEIRKREEEQRRRDERPFIELPLPMPPALPPHVTEPGTPGGVPAKKPDGDSDRGVIIIDLVSDDH